MGSLYSICEHKAIKPLHGLQGSTSDVIEEPQLTVYVQYVHRVSDVSGTVVTDDVLTS